MGIKKAMSGFSVLEDYLNNHSQKFFVYLCFCRGRKKSPQNLSYMTNSLLKKYGNFLAN